MTESKKAKKKIKKDKKMITPYFKHKDFELFKANSLEFLATLKENSVDMIFADPPYLLSSGGFTCDGGKMVSVNKGQWDVSNGLKKDFEFHLAWTQACHRVLKPGGTLWVSGTYHSIYQCGFALQVNKFHILNDIAWFKPNASPNLSCRFFTASHETIVWGRKDKKAKHIFNYDLMVFLTQSRNSVFISSSYSFSTRRLNSSLDRNARTNLRFLV